MKKIFTISLVVFLSLTFSNIVLADIAPPKAPYPHITVMTKALLGNLYNDYIVISPNQGDDNWTVLDNQVLYDGNRWVHSALKKTDIETNNDVFSTGTEKFGTEQTPYIQIYIKDPQKFKSYIYKFVININDPILNLPVEKLGGYDQDTNSDLILESKLIDSDEIVFIDKNYVQFPFGIELYVRQGKNDSNCYTGWTEGKKDCLFGEKTLNYFPKEIVGNNIVMTTTDVIPESTYTDQISTTETQIETTTTQTPKKQIITTNESKDENILSTTTIENTTKKDMATNEAHWYNKVWNSIVSFFKSLKSLF